MVSNRTPNQSGLMLQKIYKPCAVRRGPGMSGQGNGGRSRITIGRRFFPSISADALMAR